MNHPIGRREFLRQSAVGTSAIGYQTALGLASRLAWARGETRQVHLIIHRQALQAAPQNRWAALQQAVRWGADHTVTLEVDLRATKDGRIILFHDPWFDGQNAEVLGPTTDWLWEEISDVDFGSWYDRRFNQERLVLFEDALDFCERNHVRLTLDIKETVTPEMVRAILKKHGGENLIYWAWRGGFGKLAGTQIKIMRFDGDRERVREAVRGAAGNTVWVDDPRVLLDLLHREVPQRELRLPEMGLDYRVGDLDPDTLQRLVRSGGDPGRIAAARLRKHFKRRAIAAFTAILNETRSNTEVKTIAAHAVGRMGETLRRAEDGLKIATSLAALLVDSDPELGAASAYALGKLKHEPAMDRLSAMLRDRTQRDPVRMAAARALGRIGSHRSAGTLAEAATHEREQATREALPRFQELMKKKELYWAIPQVLHACYWALGEIGGTEALECLIAQYHTKQLTEKNALIETVLVRDRALDAAARIGGRRVLAAAKERAWNPPFDTYMDMLRLTRRFASNEVVPLLLEFLDHPKVFQRQEAFYALLRMGEPALEPLIGLLRNQEASPLAREWAAWTLGWTRDARAVSPLLDALGDGEPGVRAKAAWAMGKMRINSSSKQLNAMTKDADTLVRDYATEALDRLNHTRR